MAPRSAPAYEPVRVDEQCEAISVLGDVAKDEDGKHHCTCTACSD